MKDVLSGIAVESDRNRGFLSRTQVDRVLPTRVERPGSADPARKHLKWVQVEMYRVVEIGHEPPHFDRAEFRCGRDVVRAERFAVDEPALHVFDVAGFETERPRHSRPSGIESVYR